MLHYHTLLKKFGPLVSLWSMRFEAKHRISKISANTSSNRRNICKTLAIKHQLQLNDMFLKGTLSNAIEIGPSKFVIDTEVEEIKKHNIQIDSKNLLIKSPWILVKGTKYKTKMVLICNIEENGLPKCCIIGQIYLYDNKHVIFKCVELETIVFDEHIFSYEVKVENTYQFLYHHMLPSFIPNNINILPNGYKYVTLRSSI